MKKLLASLVLVSVAILATTLWTGRQHRTPLSGVEQQTLRDAPAEVNAIDLKEIKDSLKKKSSDIQDVKAKASGGAEAGPGEAAALEDGIQKAGFARNAKVRDGLRDDLKDKVRVYSWTGPEARDFAIRHAWVFPAELFPMRNLPVPVPALESGESEGPAAADEVRGIVHYIASSRPDRTLYFDLDRPQKVAVKDGMPQNHPYAQAGYVSRGSFAIPDQALLKDALQRAGFQIGEKDFAGIAANLQAALAKRQGGEPYTITGIAQYKALNLTLGDNRLFGRLWPALDEAFKSAAGHEGNPGPGHAFDLGGLGPDAGKALPDTLDIPGNPAAGDPAELAAKEVKADDDSAALYANADKTRWYLVYKLRDGAGQRELRSQASLVFAKGDKSRPAPPAGACSLRGLSAKGVPANGEMRYAGSAQKGVWYAVKSKTVSSQGAVDSSDNCLGAVLWWGQDEKAAQAACRKD